MNSNQQIARYAGIGYLIIFISGIFSNFFVLESLIVAGDAATTSNNFAAHATLFRIGLFSFVVMVIFDVFLSWALYVLLKPVNSHLSLLAGWLRLVNSMIFAMALYHLLMVLQILSGAEYLNTFTTEQLHSQVMLAMASFNHTWLIGLVFFGLHLIILGFLIYQSGYMPRFIGILLILAAAGYLADSFAQFMLTNYENYKNIFMIIVVVPGIVGELSLTFWLLIKNKKIPENETGD